MQVGPTMRWARLRFPKTCGVFGALIVVLGRRPPNDLWAPARPQDHPYRDRGSLPRRRGDGERSGGDSGSGAV